MGKREKGKETKEIVNLTSLIIIVICVEHINSIRILFELVHFIIIKQVEKKKYLNGAWWSMFVTSIYG